MLLWEKCDIKDIAYYVLLSLNLMIEYILNQEMQPCCENNNIL